MTDSVRDLMREWALVDMQIHVRRDEWRRYGLQPAGIESHQIYVNLKRRRRRIEARIYKLSPQLNSWGQR